MPRGLSNWSAGEVIRFLKKHGFTQVHTRGSHFYYRKGKGALVCIPVHAKGGILHPKTMKSIVRQAGIPLEEWVP